METIFGPLELADRTPWLSDQKTMPELSEPLKLEKSHFLSFQTVWTHFVQSIDKINFWLSWTKIFAGQAKKCRAFNV